MQIILNSENPEDLKLIEKILGATQPVETPKPKKKVAEKPEVKIRHEDVKELAIAVRNQVEKNDPGNGVKVVKGIMNSLGFKAVSDCPEELLNEFHSKLTDEAQKYE